MPTRPVHCSWILIKNRPYVECTWTWTWPLSCVGFLCASHYSVQKKFRIKCSQYPPSPNPPGKETDKHQSIHHNDRCQEPSDEKLGLYQFHLFTCFMYIIQCSPRTLCAPARPMMPALPLYLVHQLWMCKYCKWPVIALAMLSCSKRNAKQILKSLEERGGRGPVNEVSQLSMPLWYETCYCYLPQDGQIRD